MNFLKKYDDIKYDKTVKIKNNRVMYHGHYVLINDYIYLMSYYTKSIGIFKCFSHVNIKRYIEKHNSLYNRPIKCGADIIKYMIKNMYINYDNILCRFGINCTYTTIMSHNLWYTFEINNNKLFVKYKLHSHYKLVDMYAKYNYTVNVYDLYDKRGGKFIRDHDYDYRLITIYKWRYLWNKLKYGTFEEVIDAVNEHGINMNELILMNDMYNKTYRKNNTIANNLRQLCNQSLRFVNKI
jgi:hypothetical protein